MHAKSAASRARQAAIRRPSSSIWPAPAGTLSARPDVGARLVPHRRRLHARGTAPALRFLEGRAKAPPVGPCRRASRHEGDARPRPRIAPVRPGRLSDAAHALRQRWPSSPPGRRPPSSGISSGLPHHRRRRQSRAGGGERRSRSRQGGRGRRQSARRQGQRTRSPCRSPRSSSPLSWSRPPERRRDPIAVSVGDADADRVQRYRRNIDYVRSLRLGRSSVAVFPHGPRHGAPSEPPNKQRPRLHDADGRLNHAAEVCAGGPRGGAVMALFSKCRGRRRRI